MTALNTTLLVALVSTIAGFFLASVALPGTAPTRFGGVCFWFARLLVGAAVAVLALGVVEVVGFQNDTPGDAPGDTTLLARMVSDAVFGAMLAAWGIVVQAIGMSSLAWRESTVPDDAPRS